MVDDYTADATLRSIEDSLKRLKTDRLDIVWVHDVAQDFHGDEWLAVYETARTGAFRVLTKLREEGVIKAWGLGVNRVEPIELTLDLDEPQPDGFLLAGRYTLLDHEHALQRLLPAAAAQGVDMVVGGPYSSGILAGGTHFEYQQAPPEILAKVERIKELAQQHGISIKSAALQFSLAHPAPPRSYPAPPGPAASPRTSPPSTRRSPPHSGPTCARSSSSPPSRPCPPPDHRLHRHRTTQEKTMATTAAHLDVPVAPDRVWQLIGGFDSLPDWLPYIPVSTLSEGGRVRSLTNEDGGVIVERLEAFDNKARSYSYSILSAPFPVTDYLSTLTVHGVPGEGGSRVEWSGSFTPVGVTDDEAVALFQGIYADGLDALKQALGA